MYSVHLHKDQATSWLGGGQWWLWQQHLDDSHSYRVQYTSYSILIAVILGREVIRQTNSLDTEAEAIPT
jgi:hypothetical protein